MKKATLIVTLVGLLLTAGCTSKEEVTILNDPHIAHDYNILQRFQT